MPDTEQYFTLQDYITILLKHWKLFVATALLFLVAGWLFWWTRPSLPFPYNTTIEIGSNADGTLIEDIDTVKYKLDEAYIPMVLNKKAIELGYDERRYGVEVKRTEKSKAIVLRSFGGKEDPNILSIHKGIVDFIIEDHKQKAASIRQDLAQQKFKLELDLQQLKEQNRSSKRRYEILEGTVALLKRQIETVTQLVANLERDRSKIISSSSSRPMTESETSQLLLLDNTLVVYREQLRKLEDRLYVDLQNQRLALDQDQTKSGGAVRILEQSIKDIDFRLENIRLTRLLLPPSRLLREPPTGPNQTLLIFGGVGFILSLFIIVFAELFAAAYHRMRMKV